MLKDQEKNKDNWHYRINTETKVEMDRTYSKNEGKWVDQTLHRVATKERVEIKRTTEQKTAGRLNNEGGNHLEQESNRLDRGQWKALIKMEGYILQWMDKAQVKGKYPYCFVSFWIIRLHMLVPMILIVQNSITDGL